MLRRTGLGVALGVVTGMMPMVPLAVMRSARLGGTGLGGTGLGGTTLRGATLAGAAGGRAALSGSRNSHRRHRHGETAGDCQQRCEFHLRHSRKLPIRPPTNCRRPRQQFVNRQTGSCGEAPWLQSARRKLRSLRAAWLAQTKTRTRIVTKSRYAANSHPEPCRATQSSTVERGCFAGLLPDQPGVRR